MALAIAGCFSMAIAQPLFDMLSKNPGFLTAHGLVGWRLAALAGALGGLAPLLLAALFLVLDRLRQLGTAFAGLAISVLSTLFFLLVVRRLTPALWDVSWLPLAVALLSGILVGVLATRTSRARRFLAFLALGVFGFPILFLFNENLRELRTTETPDDFALAADLDPRPVLFVVFDELPTSTLMAPDESIDRGRYPNFDELAGTSTWYRRATAGSVETSFAVPAILTGKLPTQRREPVVATYPQNLFTWLGESRYELFVRQLQTRMCPSELCRDFVRAPAPAASTQRLLEDLGILFGHLVTPTRWAQRLPAVDQSWQGFREGASRARNVRITSIPQIVDSFLAVIQPAPLGRLYYLHLNLPHVPWKFLPSGTEYGPLGRSVRPPGVEQEGWGPDEWLSLQGYQQHLLQSGYADHVLGQLMRRFREQDLWDEAVVIVTADHGTSFWPGMSRRGVEAGNAEDILEVPLFIKLPYQTESATDDRAAQTLDLLPTIAEVLQGELPWETEGRSLLRPLPSDTTKRSYVYPSTGMQPRPVEVSELGRRRTLERKHRHFGSGDVGSLFAIGKHSELLGRSLSEFELDGSPRAYRVVDQYAFRDVVPESGFLPARVWAELEASPPTPPALDEKSTWFAVSLNGTIRATTRPFVDSAGKTWLTALVPEESLVRGANDVEILEISRSDPFELKLMNPKSSADVRLLESESGVVGLSVSSPERSEEIFLVRVVPKAVRGTAEFSSDRLTGWAVSEEQPQKPYEELFVFRDGKLLFQGEGERRTSGPAPLPYSSFRVELSRMEPADVDRVQLFARVGNVASELSRPTRGQRAGVLAAADLQRAAGRKLLLTSAQGSPIRVRNGAVVGDVARVQVVGNNLQIEGWAAQTKNRHPAIGFVVVANGQSVDGSFERVDMPAIAGGHGLPEFSDYGFRVLVKVDRLGAPEGTRVRLFALTDGDLGGELQKSGRRLQSVIRRSLLEQEER